MRNLLNNESEMLQNSSISALFSEVQNITNLLDNAYKSKLTTKIALGKKAILFKKWLKSDEATNLFEDNMLEKWSIDEMSLKVFSVKQSQLNRMIKASKSETKLDLYLTSCDESEANGKNVIRSIDNFNKFVKSLEVSEEAEAEATIPTIFTLAFKIKEIDQNAERNISVRINENMELITKNSVEEIQKAIDFLSAKLENPIASETFTNLS
tara:strand:- start:767 stop:1399 length:633 start_codon:yes stop_codon:yes gene_type:complete